MRLRKFKPSDQAQTEALILSGLGEYFSDFKPELNPDVFDIQTFYIDKGHSVWVLEHENKLIGVGVLKVYEDNSGELIRISVDAEYRRRGIGRLISTHLINEARTLTLTNVIVETNATWVKPIALYQQLGFIEYKRLPAPYNPNLIETFFRLHLNK